MELSNLVLVGLSVGICGAYSVNKIIKNPQTYNSIEKKVDYIGKSILNGLMISSTAKKFQFQMTLLSPTYGNYAFCILALYLAYYVTNLARR